MKKKLDDQQENDAKKPSETPTPPTFPHFGGGSTVTIDGEPFGPDSKVRDILGTLNRKAERGDLGSATAVPSIQLMGHITAVSDLEWREPGTDAASESRSGESIEARKAFRKLAQDYWMRQSDGGARKMDTIRDAVRALLESPDAPRYYKKRYTERVAGDFIKGLRGKMKSLAEKRKKDPGFYFP